MKHRKLGFLHGITQRLRRRFRDGAVRLCPTARRGLVVCIRVLIGAFGANGVAGLSAGQVFTLAAGQVTAPVRVSIPSRAGSAIAVARTMPASGGRDSRLRALAVEMSSHAAEALRIAAWSDAITPTIEAPIELDRSEILAALIQDGPTPPRGVWAALRAGRTAAPRVKQSDTVESSGTSGLEEAVRERRVSLRSASLQRDEDLDRACALVVKHALLGALDRAMLAQAEDGLGPAGPLPAEVIRQIVDALPPPPIHPGSDQVRQRLLEKVGRLRIGVRASPSAKSAVREAEAEFRESCAVARAWLARLDVVHAILARHADSEGMAIIRLSRATRLASAGWDPDTASTMDPRPLGEDGVSPLTGTERPYDRVLAEIRAARNRGYVCAALAERLRVTHTIEVELFDAVCIDSDGELQFAKRRVRVSAERLDDWRRACGVRPTAGTARPSSRSPTPSRRIRDAPFGIKPLGVRSPVHDVGASPINRSATSVVHVGARPTGAHLSAREHRMTANFTPSERGFKSESKLFERVVIGIAWNDEWIIDDHRDSCTELWNLRTIPMAQSPESIGFHVEGQDRIACCAREPCCARVCDAVRAARAINGECDRRIADVAKHLEHRASRATRVRSAYGAVSELGEKPRDPLPIETLARHGSHVSIAEVDQCWHDSAVPERGDWIPKGERPLKMLAPFEAKAIGRAPSREERVTQAGNEFYLQPLGIRSAPGRGVQFVEPRCWGAGVVRRCVHLREAYGKAAPRLTSRTVENSLDRYERQMRLAGFGERGQRRLGASRVLIAGCGALGTVVAEQLVRAGVGTVTIVDRDIVDRSNLQRQTLFAERDADRGTPKAEAAKARLLQIRSDARVRAVVDDIRGDNARRICDEHDILVDCLDNFETRYVLNDCSVALGLPFVYGGAVGFRGMAALLLPVTGVTRVEPEFDPVVAAPIAAPSLVNDRAPSSSRISYGLAQVTPCLRCIAPEPPTPGEVETCDTVGVLAASTGIVGSLEASLVLRLAAADPTASRNDFVHALYRFDLSAGSFSCSTLQEARDPDCRCCAAGRFEFLDGAGMIKRRARTLCGRNAVEVPIGGALESEGISRIVTRFELLGKVERFDYEGSSTLSVHWQDGGVAWSLNLVASKDATRVVVGGTPDPEVARGLIARVLG